MLPWIIVIHLCWRNRRNQELLPEVTLIYTAMFIKFNGCPGYVLQMQVLKSIGNKIFFNKKHKHDN